VSRSRRSKKEQGARSKEQGAWGVRNEERARGHYKTKSLTSKIHVSVLASTNVRSKSHTTRVFLGSCLTSTFNVLVAAAAAAVVVAMLYTEITLTQLYCRMKKFLKETR
jgi:hypothetical protein